MWGAMAKCIWQSANEMLGVSKEDSKRINGASWWNQGAIEKVQVKE